MIKTNDIIKAFDVEPLAGRPDRFVIGKVVRVSEDHIEILCSEDTEGFRDHDFITIPQPGHAIDDWDGRVTVVKKFNHDRFFSDWKTAPRTMP